MKTIKRLVLKNFKRFRALELEFDNELNILVGSNEAGKSSILQALDIVMSASRSKVEAIGLETLFNQECITEFMQGKRNIADLPQMIVEIYIEGLENHSFDGRNNSKGQDAVGVVLACKPQDDYSKEIKALLTESEDSFPFEYYGIQFQTFADEHTNQHRKPVKHVLVDNAQVSAEYATSVYTRSMYAAHASTIDRHRHGFEYRRTKLNFRDNILKTLNDTLDTYKFDVRTGPKASLETDIIITENDIPIDSKGKGRQCLIKTEFALRNKEHTIDVLLLEEPENHLSHVNMRRLIDRIRASTRKQIFIATHSSFIATRLDLRKVLILSEDNPTKSATLQSLSPGTARFFMKAPDNNVLNLALCKKAILVEGDAEYILMDAFYQRATHGATADADGVHIISVDGTSFKRYLELASFLDIRVAAIRDNDHDYQTKCVDSYTEYSEEQIRVFADANNQRHTFEICVYQDNREICDSEFSSCRKTLTVEEFMLANKTDAAFALLENHSDTLVPPNYIKEAVEWIRA